VQEEGRKGWRGAVAFVRFRKSVARLGNGNGKTTALGKGGY